MVNSAFDVFIATKKSKFSGFKLRFFCDFDLIEIAIFEDLGG